MVKPPRAIVTSTSLNERIELEPISDKSFVIKDIYYDFDQWTLSPEAKKAIDDYLLGVLQINANIKVEISSHTDSRGSGIYNQRLSQKRADAVVKYLVNKGIASNRLSAKGYGPSQPVDTNDTDEGRQLNRRTEFMITAN